jgi:hypothetical protein
VTDPIVSALMGTAWCVGRVAYTIGYCRRDKENGSGRRIGSLPSSLIEFAMLIMSGMTGYRMVMG